MLYQVIVIIQVAIHAQLHIASILFYETDVSCLNLPWMHRGFSQQLVLSDLGGIVELVHLICTY